MIVNIVYGFLGAGKTTFIRRLLADPPKHEKLVVLVNEFGDVGLDGIVLDDENNKAADVVEVSAGCICCTMAADFRRQIIELTRQFSPDRLVIEPTGVATISQLTAILERRDLTPLYTAIQLTLILDATEFLSFVKKNRHFMENQIRAAKIIILNKVDGVSAARVKLLTESVKEINPDAQVIPSRFCELETPLLTRILNNPSADTAALDSNPEKEKKETPENGPGTDMASLYQTFGKEYRDDRFNRDRLLSFFKMLQTGKWGDMVRAKGNFNTGQGWVRIELASGKVNHETGQVSPDNQSRVAIIGQFMNFPEIGSALEKCITMQSEDGIAAG